MSGRIDKFPFYVIDQFAGIPHSVKGWSAYLNRDRWDDWGKYCTQFDLTVIDGAGEKHHIGQVKIGQRDLKPHDVSGHIPEGHREPNVPSSFDQLDEDFFSIGQDEDYYDNLKALGDEVRKRVLSCLRDVAWEKERWEWAKNEYVMEESLLRSVTRSTVTGQFRRMAHGDARVTPYEFTYSPPKRMGQDAPPFILDFSVDPQSPIPTNVHVLIGRNGVGKTRILTLMAKALVSKDASARQSGKFTFSEFKGFEEQFANVLAVSFSAFDEGDLLPESSPDTGSLGFSFIGLRSPTKEARATSNEIKSLNKLATDFVASLRECRIGSRRKRWESAIDTLQTDPVFNAAQLRAMIDHDISNTDVRKQVSHIFKDLSAGHKIVLLTITRLIEKVEEKTLVLIDELEAHLHPPLLSAMIRAISELMVSRNGVAIVATHSPVILQEVPKSCVWILDRLLESSKAERPSIETFAENVGILSREVFQLELARSGYHRILKSLKQKAPSYKDALIQLNNQLGAEGKAVLRGMYLYDKE